MKPILFYFFLITLICTLSKNECLQSQKNMTKIFSEFFDDPTRSEMQCEGKVKLKGANILLNDDVDGNFPRKKTNFFEKKKLGWDASAYFFDYIDPVFQKIIVSEFERIYKEARKIEAPEKYKEPYTLDKLLGRSSTKEKLSKKEIVQKIISRNPKFDINIWESSISCGQMNSIIKNWNWKISSDSADPGKTILDKYDYDGDGRLNPREFILAMIENNLEYVSSSTNPCKNCLEKIIPEKIDPIFQYFDCADKNIVTSEQIWNGLKKLKRSTTGFNLYKCVLQDGRYGTSAINDFVLKSQDKGNGRLNIKEFREGFLLGYWDRHVDEKKFYTDDTRNLKRLRWSANGEVDIICDKLKLNVSRFNKKIS